jgi:hypothetical protein
LGDQSGLGRIISSIAIDRLRAFTQPRPKTDLSTGLASWESEQKRTARPNWV